jgi:hypothetical protein
MDELTTLHNAIEATFRAGLPSVVSVEAFPELKHPTMAAAKLP